jgi:uncharacterized membrane protein YhhN
MSLARIRYRIIQRKQEALFTAFYFLVSLVEICAEYFRHSPLIFASKPLIILFLISIYWFTSARVSYFYIMALLFSWLANIFFISEDFESIFVGALLFFIYRLMIIYIVIRHTKLPGLFPLLVGCVPFVFVYMYLVNLTYDAIGDGLVIFIGQCVVISFLGGLSLGNYILRSNRENTMLLTSTLFFAVTQFIFVIRLYYINVKIFQPVAMALFVIAQYMFYRYLVLSEQKLARLKSVNASQHDAG